MPFPTYETPFVSYAQAREDVVLVRSLRDVPVEQGFYIDIGAYHPEVHSVTKAFYDAGWHGINVEPSAKLMAPFREDRPRDVNLEIAVSSRPGTVTFFDNENGELGTLEQRYADSNSHERPVPAMTLTQICESHAPADIHFLKIDVEGHERAALEGMDFGRFRPWIMIIEAVVPNTHIPTFHEWEDLVLSAGYDFVLADAINRYYVAEEHIHMAPNFTLVADNFYQCDERWSLETARRRVRELESDAERHKQAEAENETLRLRLVEAHDRLAELETDSNRKLEKRLSPLARFLGTR